MNEDSNTLTHYAISALILVAALFLSRVVTHFIFGKLRKLAERTKSTLDDKLLPALESPVATLIMLSGIIAALKVVHLGERTAMIVNGSTTVATSLVIFWGLLVAFNALLNHAHEIAHSRKLGIAVFMPWIKRTLIAIFVVVGALLVAQSMGFNVTSILGGLGIGGLAFALAAQETIANLFGSIVVAIDQPFLVGESVRIGAQTGIVEDIGLRSTKIRLNDKSLAVLPNRMVASEAIVNLSRFTQRRVEQVIGLTYDTKPDQMEGIVSDLRRLLLVEPEVDKDSVHVFFRDYSASSLDIWIAYHTRDPDMRHHLEVRQQLNLAIMRAVEARGLSFAFPTQTIYIKGESERAAKIAAPPH